MRAEMDVERDPNYGWRLDIEQQRRKLEETNVQHVLNCSLSILSSAVLKMLMSLLSIPFNI